MNNELTYMNFEEVISTIWLFVGDKEEDDVDVFEGKFLQRCFVCLEKATMRIVRLAMRKMKDENGKKLWIVTKDFLLLLLIVFVDCKKEQSFEFESLMFVSLND